MKLLRCHIENFGKLHNFDYTFNPQINYIKEENGWGKTTMSVFIKSMFYGLKASTKRSVDENERKKYTPWNGNNFGGYLEFEIGNNQYRITRFFNNKESEDTFKLINLKTQKESNDYTQNIGVEILGIDEGAYERSTFIPPNMLNDFKNNNLLNRLTMLINGSKDDSSIENALDIIDKRRSELTKKNKNGLIDNLEEEIEKKAKEISILKEESKRIEEIQNSMSDNDKAINQLQVELDKNKDAIAQYTKNAELIANINANQNICEKLQQEIDEKKKVLNDVNVTKSELDSFLEKNDSLNSKKTAIVTLSSNATEHSKLSELLHYFHSEENIPNKETLQTYRAKILSSNQSTNNKPVPSVKKQSKKYLFLLIPSVILFIVGAVLINFNLIVSIVSFVLGVLCLLACAFLYFKQLIEVRTSNVSSSNANSEGNDETRFELGIDIKTFIEKYEPYSKDYLKAIDEIEMKTKEYEILKESKEKNDNIIQGIQNEVDILSNEIETFLSQFNFDEEQTYNDKFYTLKNILNSLKDIEKEYEKQLEKRNQLILQKPENIGDVDIYELQKNQQSLQEEMDNLKEIKIKNATSISKLQDEVSSLNDFENEKENLIEEKEKLKAELNTIKNTEKYLKLASDSLSSKFLSPMLQGLKKYLTLITNEKYDHVMIDTDLDISFEAFGGKKSIDYFSDGYKSLVDFCMRLSLIDVLFEKEKPFIILDDPFANMDEMKIENALALIQKVSNDFQIIYFLCHESRM